MDKTDNTLTLEHVFDGRELEMSYAKQTLKYIQALWGRNVKLVSKTKEGREFILKCDYLGKVVVVDGNK